MIFSMLFLFQKVQSLQGLQSYCKQFGTLIPLSGALIANDACCTCGGGTFLVQVINATVIRHPTMGRVDLFLPHTVTNGQILRMNYTKHGSDQSRWIGGLDGLYTSSFSHLLIENNVWPTLINSSVRNENASLLSLEFSGRGIVHGSSNTFLHSEFTIVLEDYRLCTRPWHSPIRTTIHPTLIEYVTNSSSELTTNFGLLNLTLPITIASYHEIYITYSSRGDAQAPQRDDTRRPIYSTTQFRETTDALTKHHLLTDSRHLPIRNFTRYVVFQFCCLFVCAHAHCLQQEHEKDNTLYGTSIVPVIKKFERFKDKFFSNLFL